MVGLWVIPPQTLRNYRKWVLLFMFEVLMGRRCRPPSQTLATLLKENLIIYIWSIDGLAAYATITHTPNVIESEFDYL